jgi:hypothetical protein
MFSALFSVAAALVLLPLFSSAQYPNPAQKLPPPCTVSGRVVTAAEPCSVKPVKNRLDSDRPSHGRP